MPGEQTPSVSTNYNFGRGGFHGNTHSLDPADAMAQVTVIETLIRDVLAEWPSVVYSDQIKQLVREAERKQCKQNPSA